MGGRTKIVGVMLAALLVLAGVAQANSLGQVSLKYVECDPKQAAYTYVDGVKKGPFYTGTYKLELDPAVQVGAEAVTLVESAAPSYVISSNCADLMEYAPGNFQLYDIYLPKDAPIGGGQGPMDPDRPADLRRLFDRHLGKVVDDNTAAAFQACVWEIIYEGTGDYDVNYLSDDKGTFYVEEYSGSDWRLTANGWLDDLGTVDPDIGLRVLANMGAQDYAITIAGLGSRPVIPEPLTMLGVFLGVSSLAGYVRRKRPS